MNKTELIEAIGLQSGLSKASVDQVLIALRDCARSELAVGHDFMIPGMVKLSVRQRAARVGRNPRTGESVNIPEKKVIHVKAMKGLTEGLEL